MHKRATLPVDNVLVLLTLACVSLAACRSGHPTAPPAKTAEAAAPAEAPASPPPPEVVAPEPAAGHFVAASAEHPGSLDKDQVRTVVRAHLEDIRTCYNRGLARDPSLAGRVELLFAIGPEGKVTNSVVQSTDLPVVARDIADCIAAAPLSWQFPRPVGGGSVLVTYPFVLETGEDDGPPAAPTK